MDLERVLTNIRNDIGNIKGNVIAIRKGQAELSDKVDELSAKVDIAIDSNADTNARVIKLEGTQHQH